MALSLPSPPGSQCPPAASFSGKPPDHPVQLLKASSITCSHGPWVSCIYTSVCFFDKYLWGVFFPPAFSSKQECCLCLNCATVLIQLQSANHLWQTRWHDGEKGRDHFRILPSLHNHQLAVRLPEGAQPTPPPFHLLLGHHTRPPCDAGKQILRGWIDTDALPMEVVNSQRKLPTPFSPSYRQSFFCMDQIQSDYQRPLGNYFFQRLCFPSFCFVLLHKVREPSMAICRKSCWAGDAFSWVRSLSSSHFFPSLHKSLPIFWQTLKVSQATLLISIIYCLPTVEALIL